MRLACTFGVVHSLGFEQGLKRIAEAGYEGLEMSCNDFVATDDGEPLARCRPLTPTEVDRSLERFAAARRQVDETGLDLIAAVFGYFWIGSLELGAMEDYFRLARAADAPALKVAGCLIGDPQSNYWDRLREAQTQLETVVGFAEKHGVRALIELHHGYLHESASQARRLCEPFDPRWLGVIHDPENMAHSGREYWPHSFDILGDYLAYVHWKNMGWVREDGAWKTTRLSLADGLVDWRAIVEALHQRGYTGYLANENRFLEDITVVESDLAYLKGILGELAGGD